MVTLIQFIEILTCTNHNEKVFIVKRLLLILILTFSFQSLTKADDIRNFEIEGVSLGDNLLSHISKDKIQKLKENYYKDNLYTAITIFPNETILEFKNFDAIVLNFLTNDSNYMLQGISGIIIYENNIFDCKKKSNEIVEEFKSLFKDSEIKNNNFEGIFGKVISVQFNFKNKDKAIVACYDYLPHETHTDHLRVSLDRKNFLIWIEEKAYK